MAIPADRRLPQPLRPRGQTLGRPDVVEQFDRSQGVDIRLAEPARELCPLRLRGQADALLLPLDILGRFSSHQLAEEVVNNTRAHCL